MENPKKVSAGEKVEKNAIPCVENLFVLPNDKSKKGHLIGSRCKECNKIFFPKMMVCPNCQKVVEMEEIALSSKGKLYCYTIVHQKVPGSVLEAPFVPIIVQLPEGVQIRSILTGTPVEALSTTSIGKDLELSFERMGEDEAGNKVMTFFYSFV